MMNKYKEGFTLIELLVVISIIGVLATLVLVSFGPAQKQARDTVRKSDLNQFRTSLENFASKGNGLYPSFIDSSGINASVTLCSYLSTTNCPEDPKSKSDATYYYKYQSDGLAADAGKSVATKYVLWSKLENVANMFWVVCSTGQSGKISSSTTFSGGTCPVVLTQ